MAYDAKSYAASNKYKAAHIKRIPLDMQITDYDKLKAMAARHGETVNGFVKAAIRERLERLQTMHGGGDPPVGSSG